MSMAKKQKKRKIKINSKFELDQEVYFPIHRNGGWQIYKGKVILISPGGVIRDGKKKLKVNEIVVELESGNMIKRYESNLWADKKKLEDSLKRVDEIRGKI